MLEKIINLGISKAEAQELIKVSKNIENDYALLLKKYPIQYLIGYVDFYGYKINVSKDVLIPRYETELLVEKTINRVNNKFKGKVNILDMCTGSGAIAIALNNEISYSSLTASDVSSLAINIAKKNAVINNSSINFVEGDLFENITDKYDVIISNPPYISKEEEIMDSVIRYEPHTALYAENNGLYFYEEILKNSINHLNKSFLIAFEIGYWQSEKIIKIVKEYYKNVKIEVEKDLSGKNRYIFIENE